MARVIQYAIAWLSILFFQDKYWHCRLTKIPFWWWNENFIYISDVIYILISIYPYAEMTYTQYTVLLLLFYRVCSKKESLQTILKPRGPSRHWKACFRCKTHCCLPPASFLLVTRLLVINLMLYLIVTFLSMVTSTQRL